MILVMDDGPPTGDPYRSSVVALLHGEGANNSTTITDNAPTPHTWTCNGNAKISTANPKFGAGAMNFDKTNSYIRSSSGVGQFNGDYTVSLWLRPSSTSGVQVFLQLGQNVDGTKRRAFYLNGTTLLIDTVNVGTEATCSIAIAANTYQHLEFTRTGTTARIFVNGVQGASWTQSGQVGNSAFVQLGVDASNWYGGDIDELYMLDGVGLHTSGFTPPAAAWLDY